MDNKTFLCIFFIIICCASIQAKAQTGFEPDQYFSAITGLKQDVERILAGERLKKKNREVLLCSVVRGQLVRLELGKLKYNDIHHEIQSEEQAADIRKWAESVEEINARMEESKPGKDCDLAFKLWNDYDNKWYATERNREAAEKEARRKEWEKLVQDTGPEYLDAVIEGTVFQIPRKYIWFQRNKSDGMPDGVNLLFNYPGLTVERDPNSQYGDRTELAGVLERGGVIRTLPCDGFEDRDECTLWRYQTGFTTQHLNCGEYDPERPWKRHRAAWRRACKFRVGFDDVRPVFDEELQMWNLRNWAYYSGPPEFPDYWFQCTRFPKDMPLEELERERCHSAFQVNDEVFFYYSFPERLFWEHKSIHNALKEKIQSFVLEPKRAVEGG